MRSCTILRTSLLEPVPKRVDSESLEVAVVQLPEVGSCRLSLFFFASWKAASATPLLEKAAGLDDPEEQQRFWKEGGMAGHLGVGAASGSDFISYWEAPGKAQVAGGLLHHQQPEQLDDAHRILCAPNVPLGCTMLFKSRGRKKPEEAT